MLLKKNEAIVMIAASESDSNLFYATSFLAPDPFVLIETARGKTLILSELEVDRARTQSNADEVISFTDVFQKLNRGSGQRFSMLDAVDHLLNKQNIQKIIVPENFPIVYTDQLRSRHYVVSSKTDPFYEKRVLKSKPEIQAIERTQRSVEKAVRLAEKMIQRSKISGSFLIYDGKRLTSEMLKQVINVTLMEDNCLAQGTIVSSGIQAVDPHNQGSGPVRANESIIIDCFPRSMDSRYFADMTRTFVRGRPSKKLKRMYQAVQGAQEIAFERIREGVNGMDIHKAIMNHFDRLGFPTGKMNGRMQGFFHGTGHGVGLDIHEAPRISRTTDFLRAGQVVTVEPGLYYADAGGVRIEDMVLVTKQGCKNLTRYRKKLEI